MAGLSGGAPASVSLTSTWAGLSSGAAASASSFYFLLQVEQQPQPQKLASKHASSRYAHLKVGDVVQVLTNLGWEQVIVKRKLDHGGKVDIVFQDGETMSDVRLNPINSNLRLSLKPETDCTLRNCPMSLSVTRPSDILIPVLIHIVIVMSLSQFLVQTPKFLSQPLKFPHPHKLQIIFPRVIVSVLSSCCQSCIVFIAVSS